MDKKVTEIVKHNKSKKISEKYDIKLTAEAFQNNEKYWNNFLKLVLLYNEIFYHLGFDSLKIMPKLSSNSIENGRIKLNSYNISLNDLKKVEPIVISANKFIDDDKLFAFNQFWSYVFEYALSNYFNDEYIDFMFKNLKQKYVNTNYDNIDKNKKDDFNYFIFKHDIFNYAGYHDIINKHIDWNHIYHKYNDTKKQYKNKQNENNKDKKLVR